MFWEEPLEGVALTPRTDGSVSTGLVAQFKTESWLRHTVICTSLPICQPSVALGPEREARRQRKIGLKPARSYT